MLHLLSVLTAFLTGAILVRLGLEKLLLREPPRRPVGHQPLPAPRVGIVSATRRKAS